MNLILEFFKINQSVCSAIESHLPQTKVDLNELYDSIIIDYLNHKNKQNVVDLGSGRIISYASKLDPNSKPFFIAIDENLTELNFNKEADNKIAADLNSELPIPNHSADLITSRYLLEHLQNPDIFVKNIEKVLKKNGKMIHLFSAKNAPFALLNRLLPKSLSQKLLLWLVPNSKDIRGFKTHYKLDYHQMIKILQKNGFKITKVYLSYYQSRYFAFFAPFYLLSIIYELIIFKLGLKNLASYIIIVAHKR